MERAEAESINMNFLFDGFLWEIAFQKAGRVKVHGRVRGERPSHKGQVRNNGVPAREEHTLTLLFTTYTIPHYVCIKNCNSKEHSASLFLSFCLKLKTS